MTSSPPPSAPGPTPPPAPLALLRERYPAHASGFLRPLLELLSLSREACGGDLDKLLILLVIGLRSTQHRDFARYTQDQLLSGEVPIFPTLGVNIQSVADSLHAPKETMRRKVTELVEAGWIHREANNLSFTARGYQDLAPVRERIELMALENYELVEAILREGHDGT